MARDKFKTVDHYINSFDGDVKIRLEKIRSIVKKTAPKAEEMISYNMPLYKLNGMLISFAAWKSHISLYPSPKVNRELKSRLSKYLSSKSTLKLPANEPLPVTFISEVVKQRLRENLNKPMAKSLSKPSSSSRSS